jgi:uncharacterized protein YkwD
MLELPSAYIRSTGMKAIIFALGVMVTCIASTPFYPLHIRQPHTPVIVSEEQDALVADINAARAASGLDPLLVDDRLARAALAHARDMAAHGYFAHEGGNDGTLTDRLRRVGFDWTFQAENIALNSSEAHAHSAFLKSPWHRANILDSRGLYIGVAALSIGTNSTLYVEDFAG